MSRHRTDLREVESSPDGRYLRFDEKLGNGAFKEVYLSYDTETGKEVAWNTVEMRRLPSNEKRRIRSETEILAELQHPHIINFYHVWENKEKDQICFTTEIVTSGTLKQYTNRVKSIKLKVIKKWCRQILTALDYLHSHCPPIIHRDLKCDNIFINGGSGEIRLGDFGLSAHRTCTHVASVLGTPEFMAPELYEESYSESVDIYAFGMCFPREEVRILTDAGFAFVDEVEQRIRAGHSVQYACYEQETRTIVYRQGKLVYPRNTAGTLVNLSQPAEARRWTQADVTDLSSCDYSEAQDEQLSLRVSPEHQMYVQLGRRHGQHGVSWSDAHKVAASALPVPPCVCPSDLQCEHRRSCARFLACADAGVQLDFRSAAAAVPLSDAYVATLDLSQRLDRRILLQLSAQQARLVVERLQRAERSRHDHGSSSAKDSLTLHTADAAQRDDWLQLLLHAGYTATFDAVSSISSDASSSPLLWRLTYTLPPSPAEAASLPADHSHPSAPILDLQGGARVDKYSGPLWCVQVDHPDHLIFVQRAARSPSPSSAAVSSPSSSSSMVTRASRPLIVGQCVLEMTSKEYPYEECSNAAQIWKKVTGGHKPDVLHRVHDAQVRAFIELCITSDSNRLSAAELLNHPFLAFRKSDNFARDNLIVTVEPRLASRNSSRPGSKPSSGTKQGGGVGGAKEVLSPLPPAQTPSPSNATHAKQLKDLFGSNAQQHHPPQQQQQQPQRPQTGQAGGSSKVHNGHAHQGQQGGISAYQVPPPGAYGDGPPATAPPATTTTMTNSTPSPATGAIGGGHGSTTTGAQSSGVSAIMVDIESAHGATANIVLHIHLDGGRRKKQIKFALDFRHDTSMSLAGEMVASLRLPDGERTTMMIASAMENKIDPWRKSYFAHMASESVSPSSQAGDEAGQQQQHAFQHTSYTQVPAGSPSPHAGGPNAHPSATRPASAAPGAHVSGIHRTPSNPNPSTLSKPSVGAPPLAVSPLPPHPSNAPARLHTAPPGGNAAGGPAPLTTRTASTPVQGVSPAASLPPDLTRSQTPGGPRPSPVPGAAVGAPMVARPATAGPMGGRVGTMPAAVAQSLTSAAAAGHAGPAASPVLTPTQAPVHAVPHASLTNAGHKHSSSLPGSNPALGVPAAASTPVGGGGGAGGVLSPPPPQLLTLSSFNSSEEFEQYLAGEFKLLSVSALKERIRSKPGGDELVKACFEKPDLIQMLVRITLQEKPSTTAQPQTQTQQQAQQQQPARSSPQQNTMPKPAQQASPPQAHGTLNLPAHAQQQQHSAPVPHVSSTLPVPRPHVSFTSSSNSASSEQPDFLSPEPALGSGSSQHGARSPPYQAAARSSLPPQISPDPFVGLDALMADASVHTPFSVTHSTADHRFPHGSSNAVPPSALPTSAVQASGQPPTLRKTSSLIDMDSPAHGHAAHHHLAPKAESTKHAGAANPHHLAPHTHHHMPHKSIDTPTQVAGGKGGLSAFPFASLDDQNSPHSRSTSVNSGAAGGLGDDLSPLASSTSIHASAMQHESDPHGTEPSAFDFQVSVSSPATTPDLGLDAGLDGDDGLGGVGGVGGGHGLGVAAQPDLDAFLSPASAPVSSRGVGHSGLNLQVGVTGMGGTASPAVSDPGSAPSSTSHTNAFPYDLLSSTRPATSGAGSTNSSAPGMHKSASAASVASSRDRERERERAARLGSSPLGGVLEDHEGDANTTSQRMDVDDLSDLLGSPNSAPASSPRHQSMAVPPPQSRTVPSAVRRHTSNPVSLDSDLQSFFGDAPATDDGDDDNNNEPSKREAGATTGGKPSLTIPASAAGHASRSVSVADKLRSHATMPAHMNLNDLADMWGQPSGGGNLSVPAADGLSATGTKPSRSHTAAEVDTHTFDRFDPFFAPRTTGANQAAPVVPAGTATTGPSKQQRTKSEADQAEAAILQFQL